MADLLSSINEHKDKNNVIVCFKLYKFIKDNNIDDEIILKRYEDRNFKVDDISQRNNIKYNAYVSDITHLEKFDQDVIAELVKCEDIYEASDNELVKTKCLIKIYALIDWDMVFPYTAYKLIMSDNLD